MLGFHRTSILLILGLLCMCNAKLKPAQNFNAAVDAEVLYKAMQGAGTDEAAIIRILTRRTLDQRLLIKAEYNKRHGDLMADLKGDLSGNFLTLMTALIQSLPEYYARLLAHAGEESEIVTDIILDSTFKELKEINKTYKKLKLNADVSLPNLLTRLKQQLTHNMIRKSFKGERSTKKDISDTDAEEDAIVLFKGRDAQVEFILTTRSFSQLRKIFKVYEEKSGKRIEEAFEDRGFTPTLESTIANVIAYTQGKPEYFAKRLFDSVYRAGTNNEMLIRVIVSRSEKDLDKIKQVFENLYGYSLSSYVYDDTSGDFRTALMNLVEA